MALRATRCLVIQLPILFATTGRCSLLSSLVGVSYRSLNFIHRAIGRLCFILAIIHVTFAILTVSISTSMICQIANSTKAFLNYLVIKLSLMVGPQTMEVLRTTPSFQFAMVVSFVPFLVSLSLIHISRDVYRTFFKFRLFAVRSSL